MLRRVRRLEAGTATLALLIGAVAALLLGGGAASLAAPDGPRIVDLSTCRSLQQFDISLGGGIPLGPDGSMSALRAAWVRREATGRAASRTPGELLSEEYSRAVAACRAATRAHS